MNGTGLKKILYAVFMGGFMAIGAILIVIGIVYAISFFSMAPGTEYNIPLGAVAPGAGVICIGLFFLFRHLYIKEANRID